MSARTIRPRPLNFNERLPVIFLNKPREDDDDAVEPALEQFLRNCEEEREREHALLSGLETSRARKKNRLSIKKHQQLLEPQSASPQRKPHGSGAAGTPRNGSSQQQQQPQPDEGDAAATPIAVPSCRDVTDYDENEQAMACADALRALEAGPSVSLVGMLPGTSPSFSTLGGGVLSLDAAAYIIYHDVMRERGVEPALLQYDMDERDEKALADIRRASGGGGGGASGSRGPAPTRASAAAERAALDEDGFEALVGALEQAHFEALQQRKELWQPDVKAGKVPKLPAAGKLLPFDAAVAELQHHHPPLPPLPRALYNHWLKRRKQEGGPLLQHLWFQQPWKAISFRVPEAGKEPQQGDMPFEAAETKNSTRGGWNRVRVNKEDAYERLFEVRNDFELLRTLADQVRKRERLKKQLHKLYRAEMTCKLGLSLHTKHVAAAPAADVGAATAPTKGASPAAAAAGSRHPARGKAAGEAGKAAGEAAKGTATAAASAAAAAAPSAAAAAAVEPPAKRRRLMAEVKAEPKSTAAAPAAQQRKELPQQQAPAVNRRGIGRLQQGKGAAPVADESASLPSSSPSPSSSSPSSDAESSSAEEEVEESKGRGARASVASANGRQAPRGRQPQPPLQQQQSRRRGSAAAAAAGAEESEDGGDASSGDVEESSEDEEMQSAEEGDEEMQSAEEGNDEEDEEASASSEEDTSEEADARLEASVKRDVIGSLSAAQHRAAQQRVARATAAVSNSDESQGERDVEEEEEEEIEEEPKKQSRRSGGAGGGPAMGRRSSTVTGNGPARMDESDTPSSSDSGDASSASDESEVEAEEPPQHRKPPARVADRRASAADTRGGGTAAGAGRGRPQTRSRSASASQSLSPDPPSSSPSRSSSPTHSDLDRPPSSSPEPSRSPSRSPQPRSKRRSGPGRATAAIAAVPRTGSRHAAPQQTVHLQQPVPQRGRQVRFVTQPTRSRHASKQAAKRTGGGSTAAGAGTGTLVKGLRELQGLFKTNGLTEGVLLAEPQPRGSPAAAAACGAVAAAAGSRDAQERPPAHRPATATGRQAPTSPPRASGRGDAGGAPASKLPQTGRATGRGGKAAGGAHATAAGAAAGQAGEAPYRSKQAQAALSTAGQAGLRATAAPRATSAATASARAAAGNSPFARSPTAARAQPPVHPGVSPSHKQRTLLRRLANSLMPVFKRPLFTRHNNKTRGAAGASADGAAAAPQPGPAPGRGAAARPAPQVARAGAQGRPAAQARSPQQQRQQQSRGQAAPGSREQQPGGVAAERARQVVKSAARRARGEPAGTTGGAAGAAGRAAPLLRQRAQTGPKRALANDALEPLTSHRKSTVGWQRELSGLTGIVASPAAGGSEPVAAAGTASAGASGKGAGGAAASQRWQAEQQRKQQKQPHKQRQQRKKQQPAAQPAPAKGAAKAGSAGATDPLRKVREGGVAKVPARKPLLRERNGLLGRGPAERPIGKVGGRNKS